MSNVELRLRDPGAAQGSLLEALLDACQGATGGGAIFAWTNASGVRALLEDDTFKKFLASANFGLVVGLDSITDRAAVEALNRVDQREGNLTVRAMLHGESALFHPKLAWFESAGRLTLIVGSGNLTMGGLKNNWEAFTVSRLTGKASTDTVQQLTDWLKAWDALLLPIADPRVMARAEQNVGNERSLKRVAKPLAVETLFGPDDAVFVAEIPKSGNRWSQANFDMENYEGFFGAKVGTQCRIVLYGVHHDGTLGAIESRPSVEVASQNYRFELDLARGLPYPDGGRPVGVFLRLDTADFLYQLVLPGTLDHGAVAAFLTQSWTGPASRMRRLRTDVATLKAAWPDGALWTARVPDL